MPIWARAHFSRFDPRSLTLAARTPPRVRVMVMVRLRVRVSSAGLPRLVGEWRQPGLLQPPLLPEVGR